MKELTEELNKVVCSLINKAKLETILEMKDCLLELKKDNREANVSDILVEIQGLIDVYEANK